MPEQPKVAERPELYADRLFRLSDASSMADDDFTSKCLEIIGVDQNDFENWPFCDVGYDYYDSSFELYGVRPGFILTPAQQKAFWELGFCKCWLNYAGGGERHYWQSNPWGSYDSTKFAKEHQNGLKQRLRLESSLRKVLTLAQESADVPARFERKIQDILREAGVKL